jgi:hypothetical protein
MSTKLKEKMLNSGGSIIMNKDLFNNIGLHATLFYSELVNKYIYFVEGRNVSVHEFFCTVDDMQRSTKLSRHQQKEAIELLESIDLIRSCRKGRPVKRYFTLNWDLSVLEMAMTYPAKEIIQRRESRVIEF